MSDSVFLYLILCFRPFFRENGILGSLLHGYPPPTRTHVRPMYLSDTDGSTPHPNSQGIHTGVNQVLSLLCRHHIPTNHLGNSRFLLQQVYILYITCLKRIRDCSGGRGPLLKFHIHAVEPLYKYNLVLFNPWAGGPCLNFIYMQWNPSIRTPL